MTKNKIQWLVVIMALIITISGIAFAFQWFLPQEKPTMGYSCYYENAVLKRQYISTTNYTEGGYCKAGCLFMDVDTEHYEFYDCGHIKSLTRENKTYYFANEGIRNDLRDGQNIQVEWCYINDKIGRRIRNIRETP